MSEIGLELSACLSFPVAGILDVHHYAELIISSLLLFWSSLWMDMYVYMYVCVYMYVYVIVYILVNELFYT